MTEQEMEVPRRERKVEQASGTTKATGATKRTTTAPDRKEEVLLTISLQGEQPPPDVDAEIARRRFWNPLREQVEKTSFHDPTEFNFEQAIKIWEDRFIGDFGQNLKLQLRHHLGLGVEYDHIRPDLETTLQAVFFETHILKYNSLEASIVITGLSKLAELFDANADVFLRFLMMYVPVVFRTTFSDLSLRGYYNFDISIPEGTKNRFARRSDVTEDKQKRTLLERLRSSIDQATGIWLVVNISLVVPVLLALVILFITFQGLIEERILLDERLDLLTTQQMRIIDDYRELTDQLAERNQTLDDALIKLLLRELVETE